MKVLEMKQISDVFDVTSSKRVFESDWTEVGVPFLRTREIVKLSNNEKLENELFISEKMYKEYTDKYGKPKEGDLLITAVGTLGATYIIKNTDKFYFKDGNVIWLKKKSDVSSRYIQYCFKSPSVKNQILKTANSAVVGTYTITNAKKTKIPLPPFPQQQKIANILDAADELRQNDKKLIAKYDELTQALFLDMFGDPVSNPKGWEKVELKKCTSKIGSGSTPRGGKETYLDEGISLIRSLNIYDNRFQYKNLAHINKEQANKLKNVIVEINDVLFNITGASVCRCCIVPVDVLPARVNQHVSILRPIKEKLSPSFLSHLLISENVKIKLLGVGSFGGAVMEAITKEQLQKFEIIMPPIELQNRFAQRVKLIEEQKTIAQKSLEKSEDLFNSLLQKAFNGELV